MDWEEGSGQDREKIRKGKEETHTKRIYGHRKSRFSLEMWQRKTPYCGRGLVLFYVSPTF
jgi:hypothetical protein